MGGLEVGGLGCLTTWARPGGQDFGVAGRLRMTYDLRERVYPTLGRVATLEVGGQDDRNEF